MLYGDSGAGKSSLINAGLLPAVERLGFSPERLRLQPRRGEEIVVERIVTGDDDTDVLPSPLTSGDAGPGARTVLSIAEFRERVSVASERHRSLLILDQFEEIVTLFEAGDGAEIRSRLVALFVDLVRGSLPVKVLFSFREDYLGRIKELLADCPELVDQALRLATPAPDTLARIIRGPFDEHHGHFSPELSPEVCAQLVAKLESRFSAGELSLSEVQIVCLRLLRAEDPGALLQEREPQGLLEDYLGEALDEMKELREVAIALLSQMVTGAGTRNVISAEDLKQRVAETDDADIPPAVLDDALDRLSRSRLVRRERRRDLDLYEITSEFLVPWISERRDALRRERERAALRRRIALLSWGGLLLLVIAGVIGVLAVLSIRQRNSARAETRRATSLALAADAQTYYAERPDVSLLLSLAALAPYRARPDSQFLAQSSMVGALANTQNDGLVAMFHDPAGQVDSVAFSPSGALLAWGGGGGVVHVWAMADRRPFATLAIGRGVVSGLAFNSSGNLLAAGTSDGQARVWRLGDPTPLLVIRTASDRALSVTFVGGADDLAVGGRNTVEIWNVAARKRTNVLTDRAGVERVAAGGSDNTLAVVQGSGGAQLFDLRSDKARGPSLTGLEFEGATFAYGASIGAVALSPDGRQIAAGAGDGQLGFLSLPSGAWETIEGNRDLDVDSVAYSSDGRILASGDNAGNIRLWSVATRRSFWSQSTGATDPVESLAVGRRGTMVAAADADGTVRVWSTAPNTSADYLEPASFAPDARLIAAPVGDDTEVAVWNTANERRVASFSALQPGSGDQYDSIAIGSHDRLVAVGSEYGVLSVWDIDRHRSILTVGRTDINNGSDYSALAFSPDGQRLAGVVNHPNATDLDEWNLSTRTLRYQMPIPGANALAFSPSGRLLGMETPDGGVQVIDASTGRTDASLESAADQSGGGGGYTWGSIAFSPNGRLVADGTQQGNVDVWDVATSQQLYSLGNVPVQNPTSSGAYPISVAFSPDGRLLLEGSEQGLTIWDLTTGDQLGKTLRVRGGIAGPVDFSANGRHLLAGLASWTHVLWSTFTQLKSWVCEIVGSDLNRAEWKQYAPGIAYERTCH